MDTPCYVNCPTLTTQSIADQNRCKINRTVTEDIDSCKCLVVRFLSCKQSGGLMIYLSVEGLPAIPGNPKITKKHITS